MIQFDSTQFVILLKMGYLAEYIFFCSFSLLFFSFIKYAVRYKTGCVIQSAIVLLCDKFHFHGPVGHFDGLKPNQIFTACIN